MPTFAAAAMVAALVAGQTNAAEGARPNHLTRCVVTVIDQARVPAQDAGLLVALEAREGAQVAAGQRLARLDDTQARMKLDVAQLRYEVARQEADSEVRVRAAQAQAEVVESVYLQGEDPTKNTGALAESDLRRLLLSPRRAQLQTDVARLELTVAKLTSQVRAAEWETAKHDVARCHITSPLDGVVVDVYKNIGEWVAAGDAILHVVRMDRLRVEGFVRADDYLPEDVLGRDVTIVVQLARGRTQRLPSKIAFASPLVEASGQYRVFAEIENRPTDGGWLVRPGLTAEMTIDVKNGGGN